MKKVTAETLRADRERRLKERMRLARLYEHAADELEQIRWPEYREAIELLRYEAKRWGR